MATRKSLLAGFGAWFSSLVFIPLAMVGNCCVWILFTPLTGEWATGVCLITCGFIYCISPVNWIPNWVPILGKLDDLVIGWLPMALGASLCYDANKTNPLPTDPMHVGPLVAGAIVLVLSAASETIRKTALGVVAIVLTPFISVQFLEIDLAIGVTLLVCGFLYIQLPWDLIPDSLPLIGRLDDMIFGWGFMVAGAAIVYLSKPDTIQNIIRIAADGVNNATMSSEL
jgi:uncharacterized membrane protein YkvA (DUF1232 family)